MNSTDMKPTMAQLMMLKTTRVNIITSISPSWKDVGFAMDLDPECLKVASIEAEHEENGPDVYCRKMFALWWESPDASLKMH